MRFHLSQCILPYCNIFRTWQALSKNTLCLIHRWLIAPDTLRPLMISHPWCSCCKHLLHKLLWLRYQILQVRLWNLRWATATSDAFSTRLLTFRDLIYGLTFLKLDVLMCHCQSISLLPLLDLLYQTYECHPVALRRHTAIVYVYGHAVPYELLSEWRPVDSRLILLIFVEKGARTEAHLRFEL